MKIVITGGHHTSALAVIDALKEKRPDVKLFFVGHTYSMKNDEHTSAEYEDIKKLGIPFYDIHAGKLYRTYNPLSFFKIPVSILKAYLLLKKIKPNCVLSFGGYIAAPMVVAASLRKIPILTHEQTVTVGFSNKLISFLAQKILVSWESSLADFPKEKTVLVGLPVRKEIFISSSSEFNFKDSLPVVYISGGKQGSHVINDALRPILPKLLEVCNVIHQCGTSTVYNDLTIFDEEKKNLSENLKQRYYPIGYISSANIGEAFTKMTLFVGRSGAHTVYELLMLNKPALLIPIPWVSHNEQVLNATVLAQKGLARILLEKDMTPEMLLSEINYMLSNLDKFTLPANASSNITGSAQFIANEVIKTATEG